MNNSNPTAMVVDPVCHMTIDPSRAAGQSTVGDQTFYFCALSCKKKFDADPGKYSAPKSSS